MWVIELNFAGHRFTHRVHDRRWSIFRPSARAFGWRPPQFRRTPAA